MKLVVGLGNVGQEYAHTRHNVGFMVVEELARQLSESWKHQPRFYSETVSSKIEAEKVILAKPDTLMNRSGKAVAALIAFYKVELKDVLVISDDLDLAFGKLRVRIGGSSGGQNGLKSVIESVGADFVRLRVGIAGTERGKIDAQAYVLHRFSAYEAKHMPSIVEQASKLVEQIISNGPKHISHTILDN